jgi:hypothetical protein
MSWAYNKTIKGLQSELSSEAFAKASAGTRYAKLAPAEAFAKAGGGHARN